MIHVVVAIGLAWLGLAFLGGGGGGGSGGLGVRRRGREGGSRLWGHHTQALDEI